MAAELVEIAIFLDTKIWGLHRERAKVENLDGDIENFIRSFVLVSQPGLRLQLLESKLVLSSVKHRETWLK